MTIKKRHLNDQEIKETAAAIMFHAQLNKLQDKDLIPYAIKRNSDRKEFAKAVRSVFKKLGLKGISVTTPTYSMACSIDISLPKRCDTYDYYRCGLPYGEEMALRKKDHALRMNGQANKFISYIVASCFPTKGDKSDTQTDYFDFKYMVN